jgi:hypothetical protein
MENVWFSEPPTCIQDTLAFEQSVIDFTKETTILAQKNRTFQR